MHLRFTETNTFAPERVTGTEAYDPINHESSYSSVTSGLGPTVTTHIIQIGSHVWVESTPPGGGWHEESSPPTPPFPLADLIPDLVDVHGIPGKVIDGHSTVGEAASLDAAGVAVLYHDLGQASSLPASAGMQGVTFDAWVGPAHHVRELDETWTLDEGAKPASSSSTPTTSISDRAST